MSEDILSIHLSFLRGAMLSTLGLCNNLLDKLEEKRITHPNLIVAVVYRDELSKIIDKFRKINSKDVSLEYIKQKRGDFLVNVKRFKAEIIKVIIQNSLGEDNEISDYLQNLEAMISDLQDLPL